MGQFDERDVALLILGVLLGFAGQLIYDIFTPAQGSLMPADWSRFFLLFAVLAVAVLLYLVLIAPKRSQEMVSPS